MFTQRKDELVFQRTVRAVREHLWTILKQIVFAGLVTLAWYWLIWRRNAHIEREDADIYLVGIFALISINWVMKATELLHFVLDQHREMVRAVKYGDVDTIIDLKDDHIPLMLPLYLVALAFIIEGLTWSMPFKTALDGESAIFIVTLVFSFYARIIYELEDPAEGGWVRDQIMRHDPELLTLDSERVFDRRWKQRPPRPGHRAGHLAKQDVAAESVAPRSNVEER